LEETVAALVKKTENTTGGDPLRWPRNTLYPQKLALLRPQAAVDRSVEFAKRTKAIKFFLRFTNFLHKQAADFITAELQATCLRWRSSYCIVYSSAKPWRNSAHSLDMKTAWEMGLNRDQSLLITSRNARRCSGFYKKWRNSRN
jgi:hypothetical protein